MKAESGARPLPSGGEPSNAELLDVRWDTRTNGITLAVGNVNCMDAGHVKHGESDHGGR